MHSQKEKWNSLLIAVQLLPAAVTEHSVHIGTAVYFTSIDAAGTCWGWEQDAASRHTDYGFPLFL